MLDRIEKIGQDAVQQAAQASDPKALERLRVAYLGRKGQVGDLLKQMAQLPADQRPEAGQRINQLKKQIAQILTERQTALKPAKASSVDPATDVTLPGDEPTLGSRHPITQTFDELFRISANLGFEVVRGPEVETEFHNFDALNIPPEHPARDAFDTQYIGDGLLLRSHTSPVQIRTMMSRTPPLRVVVPGKVYRTDTVDASHHYMFHNLEALMVGEAVTMRDLKTTLDLFCQGLYGPEIRTRLRPSFFPFTEPSAELDCSCPFCSGQGCSVCGQKGWIELGGCGMVDPNVFEAVGYDPEKYTGFAFGLGVDRLAMIKYGIDDLRLMTGNDVRFLRQF